MCVRGETEMHLFGGESSPNPHMLSLVSESLYFLFFEEGLETIYFKM